MSSILGKSCDFSRYHENLLEATKMYWLADVNKKIHNEMQTKGLKTEMLLHPQILDTLTRFLGPDLACARAGQIFINLESENNPVYKTKDGTKKFGPVEVLYNFIYGFLLLSLSR